MVNLTRPDSARRGVALLIVLAVLMITLTATSIIMSAAANASASRRLAQADHIAIDLLAAAEEPIQWWLKNESDKVILPLPPTVLEPAVAVLDDSFTLAARLIDDDEASGESPVVQITITAFDQRGMVPMQLARSGSPLRLSLPTEVLQLLDAADLPPASGTLDVQLGLDLFSRAIDDYPDVAIFPSAVAGGANRRPFGAQDAARLPALGGLVATHNRGTPVRINICTAPMPLVEAACRLAGRGDIDQIVAARTAGKRPDVPQLFDRAQSGEAASSIPSIVTTTDCWSFRIDLTVNGLKQSWWSTYTRGRPPAPLPAPRPPTPTLGHPSQIRTRAITPRKDHDWTCVQRLAIDE